MTLSRNGKHIGRPTDASLDDPKVVEELLDRIASGKGVSQVCKATDMPDAATVHRRMHADEAFAARIARAREAQQDVITDQMDELAASATPENWQVIRLRISTQQWAAARLAPRKYGLLQRHEHGGSEGGPIPIRFDSLSDSQLAGFIARLKAGGDDPDGGGDDQGS